jgi:hypothetical protein
MSGSFRADKFGFYDGEILRAKPSGNRRTIQFFRKSQGGTLADSPDLIELPTACAFPAGWERFPALNLQVARITQNGFGKKKIHYIDVLRWVENADKLNVSGSALVYRTFPDDVTGIAVDGFGNAYLTAWDDSTDVPTTPLA